MPTSPAATALRRRRRHTAVTGAASMHIAGAASMLAFKTKRQPATGKGATSKFPASASGASSRRHLNLATVVLLPLLVAACYFKQHGALSLLSRGCSCRRVFSYCGGQLHATQRPFDCSMDGSTKLACLHQCGPHIGGRVSATEGPFRQAFCVVHNQTQPSSSTWHRLACKLAGGPGGERLPGQLHGPGCPCASRSG